MPASAQPASATAAAAQVQWWWRGGKHSPVPFLPPVSSRCLHPAARNVCPAAPGRGPVAFTPYIAPVRPDPVAIYPYIIGIRSGRPYIYRPSWLNGHAHSFHGTASQHHHSQACRQQSLFPMVFHNDTFLLDGKNHAGLHER
jgi:hypothetical protein